ncbi:hypothetical protein FO519_001432 [Halicephalobus sp. NKZ332]|nr:hypothetical protein FO519_001432 [Halicephalobus sp. NKZ332]
MEPQFPVGGPCENVRPGDCNPVACGGEESACEAKYTRFYDPIMRVDRTRKSCQCVQEGACSVVGMYPFSGCRSYMSLNSAAQRMVRKWTMSNSEQVNNFSDTVRDFQLRNGNSRFCCKTSKKKRRFVSAQINGERDFRNLFSPSLILVSCFLFLF